MQPRLTVVEHSSGSYSPRTWHNASVAALTVAFAVDFETAGERLTAKASNGKHVRIALAATDPATAAAELLRAWRPHAGGTLNVAGNGIYTLRKHGWTQERVDAYVLDVLQQVHREAPLGRVVSGGQTGVDMAGAVAGVALAVDTVVTMPKGFLQRHQDGKDRVHARAEIEAQIETALAPARDAVFRADVERRFGSDEAIGVTFVRDDTGERLNVAELTALMKTFPNRGDGPGVESFLPDGGSACCCTDYAHHIARRMPGHRVEVVGFANEDNPTSRVAREQIHPGGHDFALVDDRYIVDPWVRLVPAVENQIVFDLEDEVEALRALDIYGPRECWSLLPMDNNDNKVGKERRMINIVINTSTAAFAHGQKDLEVARILEEAANEVWRERFDFKLYDINGVAVGELSEIDGAAAAAASDGCVQLKIATDTDPFDDTNPFYGKSEEVARILRAAAVKVRDGNYGFPLMDVDDNPVGTLDVGAAVAPSPEPDHASLTVLLRDGVTMLSDAMIGRCPKAATAKQWLRTAAAVPEAASDDVRKALEDVATCIKDALGTGSVRAHKASLALASAHAVIGEDGGAAPAKNVAVEMEP